LQLRNLGLFHILKEPHQWLAFDDAEPPTPILMRFFYTIIVRA